MFQPTRDEVTKNKTAHNEDPHILYSLLNVVRVLIWRMMRLLENVVYVGKIQMFGWETSGIETTCEIHVKVSVGEIEYV